MDIRFLSTFLEVAQTRHFGKAADNLYLTQSAISARIKLLEEYFNTSLFIRNRNSIQLTPAGEKLVPYAEQLSQILLEAKKALSQETIRFLGCACTPNAFDLGLDTAISDVSKTFPDLSLRTDLGNIELLSRQLNERTIDLAFTTEPMKLDNIQSNKIDQIPLAFFGRTTQSNLHEYIHIEWSPKLSDSLYQLHPACKKAKLKTSSYQIGRAQLLSSDNAVALLPANTEHPELIKLDIDCNLSIYIYMNSLLSNEAPGLLELQKYFSAQLTKLE